MHWNRRQFITGSTVTLVAATLSDLRLLAQQPAAAPTPTSFEDLRRGVGIFNGRGGTIGWLMTDGGLVVVDSQFPDTAQACLDGLKSRSSRPIEALINTHHHGDHVGGNTVFKPAVKKIVGHKNCLESQRKVAASQNPPVEQAYATETFDTTWKADIGGETVSLKYHGAGHTGGDAVVTFEKANVVHMGDLMFIKRHPFIDRPMGASIRNWMALLGKVAAEHSADTLYIFGHAKEGLKVTGGQAELKTFASYFDAVLTTTEAAIKAGKSKDEIMKTASLKGFEDYMEAPPRLTLGNVLGTAYDELTARS
jgi:glyoxylase-like metal-dependent hydrolase (beta-lactamase superfamily II)